MKKESVFKEFTNLYQLSKTLRFELRPVGKKVKYTNPDTKKVKKLSATEKMLLENHVFDIDRNIKRKYELTKPFFDKLHREFAKESLENVSLENLDSYLKIYKKFINDRKNRENLDILEKKEKVLRKQIKIFFNSKANKWTEKYSNINFKKKNIDILFQEAVFDLLKEKYGKEKDAFLKDDADKFILDKKNERISIFDAWKGFTGYFGKFWETRKNFYKDDGTATAIATRIINQNLRRFCDNLIHLKRAQDKINFSEIEKSFEKKTETIFSLDFYNTCLLQDGIDFYNKVIGGETLKDGTKVKGINELVNEYRQNHRQEKLPFLKTLDKQILSENDKDFIDEIEDEVALEKALQDFIKNTEKKITIFDKLIDELAIETISFELDKVYISKEAFNTIFHKWTNQTNEFERILYDSMEKDKLTGLKYTKAEESYKFPDFIALSYVMEALGTLDETVEFWKEHYYQSKENPGGILKLGENVGQQFLRIYKNELDRLHNKTIIVKDKHNKDKEKNIGLDNSLLLIKQLLKDFRLTDKSRIIIKDFADDVLHYYQLAKYFSIEKKREWNFAKLELGDFYLNPNFGYEKFYENAYGEIVQVYNKLRNYLTKKPFSEEKWKLNFKNPTLASGWDRNKETSNSTIILKKDERYYLGVMVKEYNQLFVDKNQKEYARHLNGENYKKMVYKQIADSSKDIHNLVLMKNGKVQRFTKMDKKIKYWPKEILKIKEKKSYTKENFDRADFEKFVDYMKQCAVGYWPDFTFNFSNTTDYENIKDFTDEINCAGYKITWQDVSKEYIEEKNENGALYLFEIHNKDWNLKDGKLKTGAKNLHTLYFESLFSNENASNNFLMKLSGMAELFFRPKTKKSKLGYNKDRKGNKVIKNRRYSENKVFLHIPIVLNRGKKNIFGFNKLMNEFLVDNPKINIIGIDRGEKHLAYYSIINQAGKILDSDSLNTINGVNYYTKLLERANKRKDQRKDWQMVADMKNLKRGYVSQVVHKLADLAIKYNAIIVLEDLNMRFKQIRGGIEKSIYQQLEKALIDKLNFLVNKEEKDSGNVGHLLRAYQLAEPVESFKDMGKQTGIIFYTQASYTSQIDPATGWRPNLYLKRGNAKINQEQVKRFNKIEFRNNRFEFTYDLKKFNKQKDYPSKTEWTLCSSVERWRWDRKLNNNKGGYVHYEDLTNEFKKLFASFDIDIADNILEQIKKINAGNKKNAKLFSSFIFLWGLLCQIRNTDGDIDGKIKKMEREHKANEIIEKDKFNADFILSPVKPFFDSRKVKKFDENLPKNGDDNGAYNIARKGVIVLKEKLPAWMEENKKLRKESRKEKYYPDLYISNTDWDNFSVNHRK